MLYSINKSSLWLPCATQTFNECSETNVQSAYSTNDMQSYSGTQIY